MMRDSSGSARRDPLDAAARSSSETAMRDSSGAARRDSLRAAVRRLPFLPFMLGVSAVLAVLAAAVGLILGGGTAAAGAAVGVGFIALIYTASTVFLTWVERVNLHLMLTAALGSYAVKLMLLIVLIGALSEAGWTGLRPMLFGVAAAAAVWICAQAWWLWYAKLPYVELPERK